MSRETAEIMDAKAKENEHRKPMLTVVQQIEHLKSKGVKFELCSEEEAADYLANYNNYLRTASYRKLYPIQDQGPYKGEYLGLDFEHLKTLSSLDKDLRIYLLQIAIDIEHFARIKLLNLCVKHNEDGYQIVQDFLSQLNRTGRNYLRRNLENRSSFGKGFDEYSGNLIAHYYQNGLPIWVLTESIEFGSFNSLYLFCSKRWSNEVMKQEHYILKSVQHLRNACAHNSCILNGINGTNRPPTQTSLLLTAELNKRGVTRSKTRRARLSNLRTLQITSLLYADNLFCGSTHSFERHIDELYRFREKYHEVAKLFDKNNVITSFFEFFFKLIDALASERAIYQSDVKP